MASRSHGWWWWAAARQASGRGRLRSRRVERGVVGGGTGQGSGAATKRPCARRMGGEPTLQTAAPKHVLTVHGGHGLHAARHVQIATMRKQLQCGTAGRCATTRVCREETPGRCSSMRVGAGKGCLDRGWQAASPLTAALDAGQGPVVVAGQRLAAAADARRRCHRHRGGAQQAAQAAQGGAHDAAGALAEGNRWRAAAGGRGLAAAGRGT